jgi:hypothetical protein
LGEFDREMKAFGLSWSAHSLSLSHTHLAHTLSKRENSPVLLLRKRRKAQRKNLCTYVCDGETPGFYSHFHFHFPLHLLFCLPRPIIHVSSSHMPARQGRWNIFSFLFVIYPPLSIIPSLITAEVLDSFFLCLFIVAIVYITTCVHMLFSLFLLEAVTEIKRCGPYFGCVFF